MEVLLRSPLEFELVPAFRQPLIFLAFDINMAPLPDYDLSVDELRVALTYLNPELKIDWSSSTSSSSRDEILARLKREAVERAAKKQRSETLARLKQEAQARAAAVQV